VNLRFPGGFNNLIMGGVGPAVADVLLDGGVEEEEVL